MSCTDGNRYVWLYELLEAICVIWHLAQHPHQASKRRFTQRWSNRRSLLSPRSRRRLDGRSSGTGPAGMRRAAALRPLCALAALLAWSAISNFNNEYARLKAGLIGKSWPTRFEKEQTSDIGNIVERVS